MQKGYVDEYRAELERMIESGIALTDPKLIELSIKLENIWIKAQQMREELNDKILQGADLTSVEIVTAARDLEDTLTAFEKIAYVS